MLNCKCHGKTNLLVNLARVQNYHGRIWGSTRQSYPILLNILQNVTKNIISQKSIKNLN